MKLYHVGPDKDPLHGSREAAKVAIALRETGADFEIEYLNRIRDMRPPAGFYKTKINPMGTVPALEDDGFLLLESGAIMRYLAEKYPDANLLPDDPQQRAKAMQWLMWEATTFCLALCNLCMVQPVKEMDAPAFESIYPFRTKDPEQSRLERQLGQEQMAHRLGVFDKALDGQRYIANDSYSIADIALGTHVALAGLVEFDLKPFANISAWLCRLEDKQAWQQEDVFTGDMQLIREKNLLT